MALLFIAAVNRLKAALVDGYPLGASTEGVGFLHLLLLF